MMGVMGLIIENTLLEISSALLILNNLLIKVEHRDLTKITNYALRVTVFCICT